MLFNKKSIEMSPYPDGKKFVVTFLDDTDLSTVENTKPVYDYLHSVGLNATKTIWVNRARRTSTYRKELETEIEDDSKEGLTIEDDDYLQFIIELRNKGFEIALHGVSSGNSYRDEIIEGLNKFKAIFGCDPNVNAFHKTNIDNLYAGKDKLNSFLLRKLESLLHNSEYQGHLDGSPYFWGDIAQQRIHYTRLPFHTINQINTLSVNPNMPFHDSRRGYVNYWFANSNGSDCSRFNKLFSKNNFKELVKHEGASIVYTHFAKGFAKKQGMGYIIDPQFELTVSRIVNEKGLWSPTISEFLDRQLALKKILILNKNSKLTIENYSNQTINDLTLKITPDVEIDIDKDNCYFTDNGSRVVIKEVPAKSKMNFKTNISNKILVSKIKDDSANYSERSKIEWYNYFGMADILLRRK
ncbi:MAG: hypothetical protein AB2598_08695 [Candidatus Thiodiazotropha sp.]